MYSLKYNISILHMYLLVIEYRCQIKDIYIFVLRKPPDSLGVQCSFSDEK